MPKIEVSVVHDPIRYFLLDGLPVQRTTWALVYESANEDELGEDKVGIVYKQDIGSPLVVPTRFSDYTDDTDTPYASMTALVADLKEFLNLSK